MRSRIKVELKGPKVISRTMTRLATLKIAIDVVV